MLIPKTELTDEAEDVIAEYLDEYRVCRRAAIVLELPEGDLAGASPSLIVGAIRHHFGFWIHDLTHGLKIARREEICRFIDIPALRPQVWNRTATYH